MLLDVTLQGSRPSGSGVEPHPPCSFRVSGFGVRVKGLSERPPECVASALRVSPPKPQTPKSQTPNPKPQTSNFKPQTQTLNPKPQTLDPPQA